MVRRFAQVTASFGNSFSGFFLEDGFPAIQTF